MANHHHAHVIIDHHHHGTPGLVYGRDASNQGVERSSYGSNYGQGATYVQGGTRYAQDMSSYDQRFSHYDIIENTHQPIGSNQLNLVSNGREGRVTTISAQDFFNYEFERPNGMVVRKGGRVQCFGNRELQPTTTFIDPWDPLVGAIQSTDPNTTVHVGGESPWTRGQPDAKRMIHINAGGAETMLSCSQYMKVITVNVQGVNYHHITLKGARSF